MKNFTLIFLLSAFAFLSCGLANAGIPQKLDKFVAETEKNCADYTKQDWEKSRREYRALLDDYKNSKEEFSNQEKEQAVRAMGRYNALLIKNGIVKSSIGIQEISAMLPDFIKGLSEGLEANSEEINRSLKSLVDTAKLSGAVQSLGDALGKIFTPAE